MKSNDYKQWLKLLDTQPNKSTNQNSRKVPKDVKPTNKKTWRQSLQLFMQPPPLKQLRKCYKSHPLIYISTYLSNYILFYLPEYLTIYLYIQLSTYLSKYILIHLTIYISTYLSIYLFILLGGRIPSVETAEKLRPAKIRHCKRCWYQKWQRQQHYP